MGLRHRIQRLEKLLQAGCGSCDLQRQARFAFPPSSKPPDLPQDHPARPLIDLLIQMDRCTVPLEVAGTTISG